MRGCAREAAGPPTLDEDNDVECVGESTRAEAEAARDAARHTDVEAIDVEEETTAGVPGASGDAGASVGSGDDSESEAILGGEATARVLAPFDLADMSQSQGI